MADLGCSLNAALAYDFLVGKGLRDFQAAAVVGNLQQESRLNPLAVSPPDPIEPSRGIAQWQPPGWYALNAFAKQSGRDPWTLDVQLDFLWHQLQSEPYLGFKELRASTTIEDATVVFQNKFERPNTAYAATSNRIAYAKSALYACPTVKVPLVEAPKRIGAVAATALFGLIAATGYGVYRALAAWKPKREPEPEPVFLPPSVPIAFRRIH